MRFPHSAKDRIALVGLFVCLHGSAQETVRSPKPNRCPPILERALDRTPKMLGKVNSQAAKLGLSGWRSFKPEQLGYPPTEEPCFTNPDLDRVWNPRVACWNLSKDGHSFDAIVLMQYINAPEKTPSQLESFEAIFIQDAFGKPKLSRVGVFMNSLYRSSFNLSSPKGFPAFIGLGETFAFEDPHDEAGVTSKYVFNPRVGLAIAGMQFETEAEHLAALKAEEGEEEMGDSPGHQGECSGLFVEKIKHWRELDGYVWVMADGSKLTAYGTKYVFTLSPSQIELLTTSSKTSAQSP